MIIGHGRDLITTEDWRTMVRGILVMATWEMMARSWAFTSMAGAWVMWLGMSCRMERKR